MRVIRAAAAAPPQFKIMQSAAIPQSGNQRIRPVRVAGATLSVVGGVQSVMKGTFPLTGGRLKGLELT
jgi:hypothetical protein